MVHGKKKKKKKKKNVYGLKTSWTVRPKENVSLHFGCMVILKKKAFMVHGKKKKKKGYCLEKCSTVRQKENVSLHFGCMVI